MDSQTDDFVKLETYASLEEATIVSSKLKAFGISSIVKYDTKGIYNLPGVGCHIMVKKGDFMNAKRILDETNTAAEELQEE